MAKNLKWWMLINSFAVLSLITACKEESTPGWTPKDQTEEEDGPEKIVVDPNKTFTHPGLLHTQEDFDRIKSKVDAGSTPWIDGWDMLVNNSHSSSSYQASPVAKLIRGGNSREEPDPDNYSKAFNDVAAAYQNALRWKISGNSLHAEAAVRILNAWASTCDLINGDSNRALAAGIYGYQFANAAEIMRDFEGWKDEDFAAFQQWMMDVWYPVSMEFLTGHYNTCDSHYWANWDLANVANVMAIGVLNDDADIYNEAIEYLMDGVGNGNLDRAIYYIHEEENLGQLQESGRDQGHALLVVGLLGTISEMAWNQGDDVYGYDDNRILKGAEYAAKYNFTSLGVPYEPYNNCDDVNQNTISSVGAGGKRPIWARLYNHYAKRKGLEGTYTQFALELHAPEGGGGDYGPNSGGYDDFGFGTLLYTRE